MRGTDNNDGSLVFDEYVALPAYGWTYSAPQYLGKLPVDSDSLAGPVACGRLSVVVTHDNSYPYSNLWLEVSTAESDFSVRRDTVDVRLADVYGRWLGSGIGTAIQCEQTVDSIYTVYGGRPLMVRHIMRVDTVTGISRIGIKFQSK